MDATVLQYVVDGICASFAPMNFAVIIAGLVFGIIGGMLPGIATVTAIALFVPFTFVMEPETALFGLGACYTGATYGGANASILINTPGQPASFVTTLDGYPMTLNGKAEEALYVALLASAIGGLFGAFMLLFFYEPLSSLGLKFGSESFFWMGLLGLTTLAAMFPDNVPRSLLAGLIGLALSTIGLDPMGALPRFTFGYFPLVQGLDMVVLMIAFFSISQMLSLLENKDDYIALYERNAAAFRDAARVLWSRCKRLLLASCGIGTLVGMLPGAGGNVAAIIAYNEAKRWSAKPELFGTGIEEGVAAPESANNASVGGALIPLMALGIPGSASAAVLASGLLAQGLMPGPTMLEQNASIAFGFIASLIMAQVFMIPVGYVLARLCTKILDVPKYYVVPAVITLSFTGSYALRSSLFDLLVLIVAGTLAYLCTKVKLPPVSMGLGVVLGTIIEESMIITLERSQHHSPFKLFFFEPLAMFFMGCCLVVLVMAVVTRKKQRVQKASTAQLASGHVPFWQMAALAIVGVLTVLYLYSALQLGGISWIFPAFIAVTALVLLPCCFWQVARSRVVATPMGSTAVHVAVHVAIMALHYALITVLGFYASMFSCMLCMLFYSVFMRGQVMTWCTAARYVTVTVLVVGLQYLAFVRFLGIEPPEALWLV